jgi:hypothetical protein
MNRLVKTAILSAALAATTLTALAPADAHDRWHHHGNGDAALAAGVLGLAVGAIAGSALADNPRYRPVYDEPIYDEPAYEEPAYARPVIVRPRPVRPYYTEYRDVGGLQPWSPEWFRWCGDTYRSFDPDTGTFVGYDGEQHFCVAN